MLKISKEKLLVVFEIIQIDNNTRHEGLERHWRNLFNDYIFCMLKY